MCLWWEKPNPSLFSSTLPQKWIAVGKDFIRPEWWCWHSVGNLHEGLEPQGEMHSPCSDWGRSRVWSFLPQEKNNAQMHTDGNFSPWPSTGHLRTHTDQYWVQFIVTNNTSALPSECAQSGWFSPLNYSPKQPLLLEMRMQSAEEFGISSQMMTVLSSWSWVRLLQQKQVLWNMKNKKE